MARIILIFIISIPLFNACTIVNDSTVPAWEEPVYVNK